MTPDLNRPPARPIAPDPAKKTIPQSSASQSATQTKSGEALILEAIKNCQNGLYEYSVRDMVNHAKEF